jgi:mitogen-activated protein kinase kinase
MLLQHAWLAPLAKPAAILEEDEEEEDQPAAASQADSTSSETTGESVAPNLPHDVVDREVAEWVWGAIEKRRQGKLGRSAKPALHAAPLDAVATPDKVPALPETAPDSTSA